MSLLNEETFKLAALRLFGAPGQGALHGLVIESEAPATVLVPVMW